MNLHNLGQLPNKSDNGQDKLKSTLIESQKVLKRLRQSVHESHAYNKKALEYLINSKSLLSRHLPQRIFSHIDNWTIIKEETGSYESKDNR